MYVIKLVLSGVSKKGINGGFGIHPLPVFRHDILFDIVFQYDLIVALLHHVHNDRRFGIPHIVTNQFSVMNTGIYQPDSFVFAGQAGEKSHLCFALLFPFKLLPHLGIKMFESVDQLFPVIKRDDLEPVVNNLSVAERPIGMEQSIVFLKPCHNIVIIPKT